MLRRDHRSRSRPDAAAAGEVGGSLRRRRRAPSHRRGRARDDGRHATQRLPGSRVAPRDRASDVRQRASLLDPRHRRSRRPWLAARRKPHLSRRHRDPVFLSLPRALVGNPGGDGRVRRLRSRRRRRAVRPSHRRRRRRPLARAARRGHRKLARPREPDLLGGQRDRARSGRKGNALDFRSQLDLGLHRARRSGLRPEFSGLGLQRLSDRLQDADRRVVRVFRDLRRILGRRRIPGAADAAPHRVSSRGRLVAHTRRSHEAAARRELRIRPLPDAPSRARPGHSPRVDALAAGDSPRRRRRISRAR